MSKIREELEQLQKHYFVALDEITKAKECLTDEIREGMQNDLYKRYRIECDQLIEQAKIEDKNINFETALKISMLTPHRRGFLWLFNNYAKKLKIREATADADSELQLREIAVERLEEAIDEADNATVADVIEQPEPTKDDVAAAHEEYKRLKKLYKLSKHNKKADKAPAEFTIPAAIKIPPPPLGVLAEEPETPGTAEEPEENATPATPATPDTPPKPKRTRRKKKAAAAEPDNDDVQSESDGQLPGQLSLNDIQSE